MRIGWSQVDAVFERLRALELATRPVHPETEAALRRRWDELPEHVKHEGQCLGRRTAGCEGTHGVFPRCDLACTPCYHSRDANRVRIDGEHTLAEIDRQMAYLRQQRGPGQYVQLIGGDERAVVEHPALGAQHLHRAVRGHAVEGESRRVVEHHLGAVGQHGRR